MLAVSPGDTPSSSTMNACALCANDVAQATAAAVTRSGSSKSFSFDCSQHGNFKHGRVSNGYATRDRNLRSARNDVPIDSRRSDYIRTFFAKENAVQTHKTQLNVRRPDARQHLTRRKTPQP